MNATPAIYNPSALANVLNPNINLGAGSTSAGIY